MERHSDLQAFVDFLAIERGMSKNSVQAYARDLRRFLDDCEKRGIQPDAVDAYALQEHLGAVQRNGISARSCARAMSAIKTFYKYLVQTGRLAEDKVGEAQGPKVRKSIPGFLDLADINRLINSVESDSPAGRRDRAMLELLYGAGVRVSELCDLNLSQIDIANGFVTVIGKGNKERTVPIGRKAREALAEYLKEARAKFLNGHKTDRVFLTRRGVGWTRQGIWKWIRGAAQSAGLGKNVYPHLMRHTFATHVLGGGADLRSVQELLGHADISTTEIYTHLDTPRLRQIHRQFHPRA